MSCNGLMEKRGGVLIDSNKQPLLDRMQTYFNGELDWEQFAATHHGLSKRYARFNPKKARKKALEAESFSEERVVRYAVRPFENQWCYYVGERPVWNEPRPQLWEQVWPGNCFVLTRLRAGKEPEGDPIYFTPFLSDDHILSPDAVAIPVFLQVQTAGITGPLLGNVKSVKRIANLSAKARAYLQELGCDPEEAVAQLWMHVLAVGLAKTYLAENRNVVRRNWPRIPLPSNNQLLQKSSSLGAEVAQLLDSDSAVIGVTAGALRTEQAVIGNLALIGPDPLNPAIDLKLTKGWGHKGGNGVNPGKGKVKQREYTADELDAISKGAATLGMSMEQALQRLGPSTCDVYLNERAYWCNIPVNVWEYFVGGYQVIKKWLSYRETKVIGRPITVAEADHVRDVARRLAAICLLGEKLDANYAAVKQAAYAWHHTAVPSADIAPETTTAEKSRT
jgi:hypothetical protein